MNNFHEHFMNNSSNFCRGLVKSANTKLLIFTDLLQLEEANRPDAT